MDFVKEEIFFEVIQVAIGFRKSLNRIFTEEEWRFVFSMVQRQAVIGLTYEAVKKLSFENEKQKPPLAILLNWVAIAEQVAGQNKILNCHCVNVLKDLKKAGFQCCILKGQGNALMYPNPLSRNTGDIDVLIRNANKEDLLNYVLNKNVTGYHYHHVEYVEEGSPVELHFHACSMNNPTYHYRLNNWLTLEAEKSNIWDNQVKLPNNVGDISIPTIEYNLIFQLAHMMHHFFDEGIGLRQMIDYYYLLRNAKDDVRSKMEDVRATLKYLNLYKFAGAVMYIMKEVLGLDEQYLIVPVDERRGKTLLNEILKGGNFGHHSGLDQKNALKKYFQKTWRNMRLVKEYPAEALCEPFFRTWHFFWRLAHKYGWGGCPGHFF
jgi:hypothetical protein